VNTIRSRTKSLRRRVACAFTLRPTPVREALVIVQHATVIAWQRRRFRDHGTRLTRAGRRGRPAVARELRRLIRTMSRANPTWGSQRIAAKLAKLGISVAKSTVEKYRIRARRPPSPTWRAFLALGGHPKPASDGQLKTGQS